MNFTIFWCCKVTYYNYPKRGIQTEMIGKVFSHVEHKMILGFKGLFLGITDGATQMLMDFCLVGEKGKKGTYNLKQKQLDARFKKERDEDSHTAKRIKEYDESKIHYIFQKNIRNTCLWALRIGFLCYFEF